MSTNLERSGAGQETTFSSDKPKIGVTSLEDDHNHPNITVVQGILDRTQTIPQSVLDLIDNVLRRPLHEDSD